MQVCACTLEMAPKTPRWAPALALRPSFKDEGRSRFRVEPAAAASPRNIMTQWPRCMNCVRCTPSYWNHGSRGGRTAPAYTSKRVPSYRRFHGSWHTDQFYQPRRRPTPAGNERRTTATHAPADHGESDSGAVVWPDAPLPRIKTATPETPPPTGVREQPTSDGYAVSDALMQTGQRAQSD